MDNSHRNASVTSLGVSLESFSEKSAILRNVPPLMTLVDAPQNLVQIQSGYLSSAAGK